MRKLLSLLSTATAIISCVLLTGGCAGASEGDKSGYETVASDPRRDEPAADGLNAEGVALMERNDFAGAEAKLKSALEADVMHGPAHNNLGKVYFHQGRLYLAAWEFQYAAKLMPSVPEPRNNLGLVFESAGKLDDAVSSYDEAMRLGPDNTQFIGNLVRARLRRGDRDDSVRDLLGQLVLRDTRPEWTRWARERLVQLGSPLANSTQDADNGSQASP
jgi:Flp pilus assembly protein TadD